VGENCRKLGELMNSCTREDSLPDIESLQRAICMADTLEKFWAKQWNNHRGPNDFAFDMYMKAECVGIYLKEHCENLGLDYRGHVDKPPSIAGEEFLDKIWDSEIGHWRKQEDIDE